MAVVRYKPLHLQVAEKYADLITQGVLKPGDQLPTMQQLGQLERVSHQTAVRAVEYLRAAKLVETSRSGSVVAPRRLISGPAAQLAGVRFPAAEKILVNAAGFIAAPERIAGIMASVPGVTGLLEVKPGQRNVIRREQVHLGPRDVPELLEVQWFAPELAEPVPELAAYASLGAGEALALIAERTGRAVSRGWHAREARPILDDGREGPMLELRPGTAVMAEVFWFSADGRTDDEPPTMLLYWEYIVRQGLVTSGEFTAA
jgi:DNA-binding transcriptional regulator YhcF (GntR family)